MARPSGPPRRPTPFAERTPEARARQLSGLRRGRPKGAAVAPGTVIIPADEPRLTRESAAELAKLLAAGLPQAKAMAYIAPEFARSCSKHQLPKWRARWMNDPLLLDAVAAINGATWQNLTPKARIDIALDKHYAELAYFLRHHDFDRLYEQDLDKAKYARLALTEKLAADKGLGVETPWQRAMRDLLEGTVKGHLPAQLAPTPPTPPDRSVN